MSRLPDAGTLDALVLNTGDSEDEGAWEALVREPGGARAWRDAVARRRRTDLVASAIQGRPWLARAVRQLSMFARQIGHAPKMDISIAFPDSELDALAAATLGPAEENDVAEIVQPRWGQTVPATIRVGNRITLRPPSEMDVIDVRYVCNGQEGSLPSRTWRLERGEAPVLLIALVATNSEETIAEAMKHARGIAAVLLLEQGNNDGSDDTRMGSTRP